MLDSYVRDNRTSSVCPLFSHGNGRRAIVLAGTDERTKQLRDTFPTPDDARDAALAELVKLQREEHEFSITLARGRADVHPETPATVTGFKAEIDRVASVVSESIHRLANNSYTNNINLEMRR